MVLEATILCLDNSDWTRNGDYYPSRWVTQIDAANLIIENRCEKNPENALGIVTMGGKRVEVQSSLTNDESRLLGAFQSIDISGECDIITALNISTLTLKHRMNKNQKQRIILFVGSPVRCTEQELTQTGKKLKKYNISVDIISFGHVDENKQLLTALLNSVNNSNTSSLVEIPVGCFLMDTLLTSPILGEGEQVMNNNNVDAGGNANNNMGNINQQGVGMSQFEREMQMAMQLSLQEANPNNQNNQNNNQGNVNVAGNTDSGAKGGNINEDEELEKAKLLSMQENDKVIQQQNEKQKQKIMEESLESHDFIKSLLEEVSGSKVKDEDVKDIINQVKINKEEKKEEKQDDKKEDKDDKDKKDDKKENKEDKDKDKNEEKK